MKAILKKILDLFKIDHSSFKEKTGFYSLCLALRENGFKDLIDRFRKIVPDISKQYSNLNEDILSPYLELKLRMQHAFQINALLDAIQNISTEKPDITIVDIGDSAGTHMIYVRELLKGSRSIDTISVNLDPIAVEKIKSRGLEAILCRAEELNLGEKEVDLFTSFQCIEHLHNPALFFHRIAERSGCSKMLITLPFTRRSRVGLYSVRNFNGKHISAEDEHIFELNPEDWTLLFNHSGWKVKKQRIYYQYPKKLPLISSFFSFFWKTIDFEGFVSFFLEKDTTYSSLYTSWED